MFLIIRLFGIREVCKKFVEPNIFEYFMKSVSEFVEEDTSGKDLLELLYGWKDTESQIFMYLLRTGSAMNIDEISEKIDKERSTVYRAVERLAERRCVDAARESLEDGGYRKVYTAPEPERLEQSMNEEIAEMKSEADQHIQSILMEYASSSAESQID